MSTEGFVLLEDGTRFDGRLCGASSGSVGEVVFTTAMGGYQESVTDPSFAGQVLTFTAPHVGNYGVSQPAMSAALSRLRTLLGDPLFQRSSAGLVPTARARDLASPVAAAQHSAQKPAPAAVSLHGRNYLGT